MRTQTRHETAWERERKHDRARASGIAHRSSSERQLALQDRLGNRGVQRLLQRKLAVSHPQDAAELEADQIADAVMAGDSAATPVVAASPMVIPAAPAASSVQRACCGGGPEPGCAECEDSLDAALFRSPAQATHLAVGPLTVPDDFGASLGAGRPLDGATRAFMEARIGHGLSAVRVHDDAAADQAARQVHARAFTVGSDVVFRQGEYVPTSTDGRRLIAHELVHTMQQNASARRAVARLEIPNPFRELPELFKLPTWRDLIPPIEVPKGEDIEDLLKRLPTLPVPKPGPRPMGFPDCIVAPGILNTVCSLYGANAWWLPLAYVNNATCACQQTPNQAKYNCIRMFLQARVLSTSTALKAAAAAMKPLEINSYPAYQTFVQSVLTPIIYRDHVDAYSSCCCAGAPAPYPAWAGVTSAPLSCNAINATIRTFGSCGPTPGAW